GERALPCVADRLLPRVAVALVPARAGLGRVRAQLRRRGAGQGGSVTEGLLVGVSVPFVPLAAGALGRALVCITPRGAGLALVAASSRGAAERGRGLLDSTLPHERLDFLESRE